MEQKGRYVDIPFTISEQEVLDQLSCGADSDCYNEFSQEYEELVSQVMEACCPEILLCAGELPAGTGIDEIDGKHIIYAFWTVGKKVSSLSSHYFSQGDYVKGMLADAMADSALFSLEEELRKILKAYCLENGCGITERFEAPYDIPMEMQRVIYEKTEGKRYGIGMSSGYMFDPVKSSACLFLVTEDQSCFKTVHDCASCPDFSCIKRNLDRVRVRLFLGEEEHTLQMKAGTALLEALSAEGIMARSDCGGIGRCGKCRMQIKKGVLESSKEDESFFSEKELEDGWRLACCARPQMNLTVRMEKQEEISAVLTVRGKRQKEQTAENIKYPEEHGKASVTYHTCAEWGIAVDIGTTTLAMQKIELDGGHIVQTWTGTNHQSRFGADVMSRIGAACRGKLGELRRCIQEDLKRGFQELIGDTAEDAVKQAVIGGNTAMLHFLLGYACEGLGRVPFTPYSLEERKGTLKELVHRSLPDIPVLILPGISAFIGADITAGLYNCRFYNWDKVNFLIDLGTNGEMALGNKQKMLCASTAAGPALEGGNISCGMGGLRGAVSHVTMQDNEVYLETISGAEPKGICGSGVLDTVSELYRTGRMDGTGRLAEPYFENGFCLTEAGDKRIFFTQRDVREVQLAKAAVRAGIEALLQRYGIGAGEVQSVFLAGGLGFSLDVDKAFTIGMFPEEFRGRIISSGNTCLGGCADYLQRYKENEKLREMVRAIEVLDLSSDPVFQEHYIDHMLFGEE